MRHRVRFFFWWSVCCAVLMTVQACNQVAPARISYAATIEGIEDLPGDHYTPTNGKIALTRVQLRSEAHGAFAIIISGIYTESVYGRVGDTVKFTGPRLPFRGEFWMEQLCDYGITR